MTIDPQQVPTARMHALLLGTVTPRPIAFASTVDKNGNVNLSPFSFFNCFGSNPPVLVFSPNRRVRDNTPKHTYENILEVPEVVIHIVNYAMAHQMSLASSEYQRGINEFAKAGFTEIPSQMVKPPRVKEAPVAFECMVKQVIATGEKGGAGNLVICEVVLMHVEDEVLDTGGKIDPFKLDAIARMGGDWYCRVNGDAIFSLPKPAEQLGIGVDQLPEIIRKSNVLTGNDLGMLASVEKLPEAPPVEEIKDDNTLQNALKKGLESVHILAHEYLEQGNVKQAWKTLLAYRSAG